MPKSATRILLEGKLPEIKADYLKGMSSIKLSEKYIPGYKGRSSTTLESIIKEMKEGKLPTKITKKELANRPKIVGLNQFEDNARKILDNPKLKKEFTTYANKPGVLIKDILDKYKISRTTLYDTGLRNLITKNVQLGNQYVDPEVTERLTKIQEVISETDLPKTQLKVDSPVVKEMAEKVEMSPKAFLQGTAKLKEIYKTGREDFVIDEKVKENIKRFPDARFNRTLFLAEGYSKKTVDMMDSVERAAKKITQTGTQLEHAMPKALIKDFKLPRSNYLKGERTSNFLNQFKAQFDNQIINAAKDFRDGKISYDQYKKTVANLVNKVAKRTGGYEQGYIDF